MLNKVKSNAFNKDCYLLGIDSYGDHIWLEEATWDCSWYWGFGYIEVYTNRKHPELSKDIISHSHYSGLFHKDKIHLNEILKESVLSDKESWELADLMTSFYTLNKTAEVLKSGSSHISSSKISKELINLDFRDKINKQLLPKIFTRIYEILQP